MVVAARHARGSASLSNIFARARDSQPLEQDEGETTHGEESVASTKRDQCTEVPDGQVPEDVFGFVPDFDEDACAVQSGTDTDQEGLGDHPATDQEGIGEKDRAEAEEPREEAENKTDFGAQGGHAEAEATPQKAEEAPETTTEGNLLEYPTFGHRGETDVWCGMCGQLAHKDRVQILNKCAGTWKCSKCNTRSVQLHKKFGQWPPTEFKDMDKDELTEFWATLKDNKFDKPSRREQFAAEAVSRMREKFEETKAGSEYLPLTVWAQRGFDTTMIEETTEPHNKKWHKNLGWTYRIPIESLFKGITVKELKSELLERKSKAKARKEAITIKEDEALASGEKDKKRAKKESEEAEGSTSEKEESNSSQNSDDDSSSSSDKKKKKKHKKSKAKKDKKDGKNKKEKDKKKELSEKEKNRKKEEAMRKREIELRAMKEKKEAQRVATLMLEKTSAVKVQLEEALGSKIITRVAQFARKDAQDSLKAIVDFHEQAKACLAQKGPNPSFNAEDVKATAASAKRRCMFLTDLLKSTQKHLGE